MTEVILNKLYKGNAYLQYLVPWIKMNKRVVNKVNHLQNRKCPLSKFLLYKYTSLQLCNKNIDVYLNDDRMY